MPWFVGVNSVDKINLNGMTFFGYHGVYPEEQKLGQKFIIDIEISIDLQQAAATDDLTVTVDYGAVYQQVKQVVEQQQFKLIEALAGRIADVVLVFPGITAVNVKVQKPEAPLPWATGCVSVELMRRKLN